VRERERRLVVRGVADRRGSFSEAVLLYQEEAAETAPIQHMISRP